MVLRLLLKKVLWSNFRSNTLIADETFRFWGYTSYQLRNTKIITGNIFGLVAAFGAGISLRSDC